MLKRGAVAVPRGGPVAHDRVDAEWGIRKQVYPVVVKSRLDLTTTTITIE